MIGVDRVPHVCALGFWLPCDQASFFQHGKDEGLERRVILDRTYPSENLLDVSVVRRLITVLPYWDYTHFFPAYHTSYARTSDPDAAVFIHEHFGEQWMDTLADDINGHGLALIVTSGGFYLWLALYSIPAGRKHQQQDEDLVRMQLTAHIRDLAGGNYFSHFSGMDDDRQRASSEDLEQSVKEYRDHHQGILTFFQLNTILEGLFNSTLDFRVFFYTDRHREEIDRAKKDYSVGNFITNITAHLRIEQRTWTDSDYVNEAHLFPESGRGTLQQQDEARIRMLLFELLSLHLEDSKTKVPASASARRMAHQLCRSYLNRLNGERLLRRFLHVTAAETLLKLKRRVERCRRALLGTMIEVTQRQQPLIQVESPDEPQDRIVGVNPAQLRGYIMLFSAKLPLIANVRFYLKELRIGDQELSEEDPVRVPYRTWLVLLRALISDVRGLERALEQSRMDALVQEEEQMRREEETISEIERLQQRTSQSLEPVTTLAISVISNVFALAAVILAFVSILNGVQGGKEIIKGLPTGWAILVGLAVVVVGLILVIVVYGAIQIGFTDLIALLVRVRKRDRRRSGQYYYEMDVHLDRDIKPEKAEILLGQQAFDFPKRARETELRLHGLAFAKPQRNSYRIERNNDDEALHKIYIDADVMLRSAHWWRRKPRLHIVVVYEIMFHRPAQSETYILQDVRVVSTTSRVLSAKEIGSLRRGVAEVFINQLIPDAEVQLVAQPARPGHAGKPVDALLSLAEYLEAEEPVPQPAAAVPTGPVLAINAIARRWWLPLLVYAVSILASVVAFFATHPLAAVWSWEGLTRLSLYDTLTLVLARQPGLFILPAVVALVLCVLAWSAVKSESLQSRQSASPEPSGAPASAAAAGGSGRAASSETPAAAEAPASGEAATSEAPVAAVEATGEASATEASTAERPATAEKPAVADAQPQPESHAQPLRWPHSALLALGALGLLGTIVALAGVALRIMGGP